MLTGTAGVRGRGRDRDAGGSHHEGTGARRRCRQRPRRRYGTFCAAAWKRTSKRRLQHIGEARILDRGRCSPAPRRARGRSAPRVARGGWPGRQRRSLVSIAIAFAIGFVLRAPKPQPRDAPERGRSAQTEDCHPASGLRRSSHPMAPRLALVARGADQKRRIYVRSLDAFHRPPRCSGTENAPQSLLFARWPVARIFRRRQAEEDLRARRRGGRAVRARR